MKSKSFKNADKSREGKERVFSRRIISRYRFLPSAIVARPASVTVSAEITSNPIKRDIEADKRNVLCLICSSVCEFFFASTVTVEIAAICRKMSNTAFRLKVN